MRKTLRQIGAFGAALLLCGAAVAQPGAASGPGAGPRAGAMPCGPASGASGPYADCPRGGPGMRGGGMGMGGRWGRDYTPGWAMMSREEQQQHREKMRAFQNYEECLTYMEQHHGQMQERAKERGVNMPGKPRRDPCGPLQPPSPKK